MINQKKKIVILCHGAFNYIKNKTGNMLIRYRSDEVMAVIDSEKSNTTAADELGYGHKIPVVKNFLACKSSSPDTLVVGSATQGGYISDDYKKDILSAIEGGCDIVSGMHQFLKDDSDIVQAANHRNVNLVDLRIPPDPPNFPKGSWQDRKIPVLLVVGTDCDTGKMTSAWELTLRLRKRGRKIHFVATGQTGILLNGSGVPIDAVKADFMAGEVEQLIDEAPSNTELVIVEGQGSLTNQYYAGVTLGLMHGAMPNYMLMTHDPGRDLDVTDFNMSPMSQIMDLHLDLMKDFRESKFIGINLLTFTLGDTDALNEITAVEKKYNLPTTDLIRFGDRDLINTIEGLL